MKKIVEAFTTTTPAKDSSAELTRWTRPTIHELGRVQGTESGVNLAEIENSGYNEGPS